MFDEARRELDEIRRRGLDELRPALWLASLTYLTDASYAVGDSQMAGELYPALERHAGEVVTIGHGVACYGSADRYLGMAAATAGDPELAARHLEVAMRVNGRMGARTWLAHTAYVYGRLLLGDDPDRAADLLRTASTLATQVGMPTLRPDRHRRRPDQPPRASGRSLAARGADPGPGGPGALEPRDR